MTIYYSSFDASDLYFCVFKDVHFITLWNVYTLSFKAIYRFYYNRKFLLLIGILLYIAIKLSTSIAVLYFKEVRYVTKHACLYILDPKIFDVGFMEYLNYLLFKRGEDFYQWCTFCINRRVKLLSMMHVLYK